MIIGSGLLACAFDHFYANDTKNIIYAAGISNSSCVDQKEFSRERVRLKEALNKSFANSRFVYFGTCSVYDPEVANSPYVRHKLEMESLVRESSNYLIFRLPQVAGNTPNPHTLLNFLYTRISRSESFNLWKNATRNVIDIDDVLLAAKNIIEQEQIKNDIVNIANPVNYKITEIVETMEVVVGKKAVFEVVDRGGDYSIDITKSALDALDFESDYLRKLMLKYYASSKRVNAYAEHSRDK